MQQAVIPVKEGNAVSVMKGNDSMFAMRRAAPRLGLVFAALLALVAITGCVRGESYEFKGAELDPASAAPPLNLIDHNGEPFSLESIEGDLALIYFGYTTCPDLCPTTLSDFKGVKDSLGDDADRVHFMMVTVDPERDTPERLKEYMRAFDPDFIGLTGDDAQLEEAKAGYGVYAQRVDYPESATGYLVDHTSLTYLIDTDGRLRLTYSTGFDPDMIVEDVKHLL